MINYLHSLVHRPESGWDPVPDAHIAGYTEHSRRNFDSGLVKMLNQRLGGLDGKRVLDLGGGHGLYSVAFAQHGADVTWHDISANYRAIAKGLAKEANVTIAFSTGYLEDAVCLVNRPYDLVFCRVCWCYCRGDRAFSETFWNLVKPGGAGYIETDITKRATGSFLRRAQVLAYSAFWFKVGHPFPPRGRIAKLFRNRAVRHINEDYSNPALDKIFFIKS
jgi:2-polyprenyl-3-methyl-5-hydroxy-6-metoxy-1,4-benzoquinol methylase